VASDAKLQHITLYFFAIFCALLTFPQVVKATIALTKHERPEEEDFHHKRLSSFLVLLTTLSLVATYALGAVITASKFDSDLTIPPVVGAMYELTKEAAIEFFYAALLLLLLLAYRGNAQAPSLTRRRRLSFGLLLIMVLCTIINAPLAAVASTPSVALASIGVRCVHFVAYFLLTTLIVLWSTYLYHKSRLVSLPRELLIFDSNVLNNIVTLMLPFITIRAAFELIVLLIMYQSAFRERISEAGFGLATVIIEGSTFFAMNMIALGLGTGPGTEEAERGERRSGKRWLK